MKHAKYLCLAFFFGASVPANCQVYSGNIVSQINQVLDTASQIYATTTIKNSIWDNDVPRLNVGQAAFFNLEPVPEPAVFNLIGAGLLVFGAARKYVFTESLNKG